MSVDQAVSAQASTPTVTVTAQSPIKAFDDGDGPSFHDVLDIINPLQHIPIINTIYRHLTGDEEGAVADVGGGALWMGPVGLVGALADLAVKSESGKSIGDNILSWLGLEDDDAPAEAAKTAENQVQQQQAQQTAAVTAPLPAITAQALAPLPSRQRGDERKDKDSAKAAEPARSGDFMVFGAAGGNQPLALTPTAPQAAERDASAPSRQGNYMVFGGGGQPQPKPQQQQQAASVSVDASGVGRRGDYMVFGGSASAATTTATIAQPAPQPVQLAQAPAPTAAVAAAAYAAPAPQSPLPSFGPAANAVANSVPPGGGPATLSAVPAHSFAAPARRSQVTPNALPMPTTGTAAVPGRAAPSQAMPATMSQQDANWFAQAMNAGLDKYAAAQKLANQDNLPAAAAAGEAATTIH